MFAGPNGSGKTTVKNGLPPELFSIYINPDELEKAIRETGVLALEPYKISFTTDELREWFSSSDFLKAHQLAEAASVIECDQGVVDFRGLPMNSYYASVLSDAIRRKLLATSISFTFETVMSSRDKVDLLRDAQALGFRTYMYFVATEDPAINLQRVQIRVNEGGHDVPVEKIVARYFRSLELVRDAILHTNRAFFFDTSLKIARYVAEITDGTQLDLKMKDVPSWFKSYVWDRL